MSELPETMRAMVLESPGRALIERELAVPTPRAGEVLVRVRACGICRTDLHVVDGELAEPKLPLVPGHQVVGEVVAAGDGVDHDRIGERVGIPWLGGTCGACDFCAEERENLCDHARFTGYQIDGGFAEYCRADARFCLPLPAGPSDLEIAPLLCAGLIGFRAYRMTGLAAASASSNDREGSARPPRLGLYGFGSAAHILIQVAVAEGREVCAFTRPGDQRSQAFARELGAVWAGGSDEQPAQPLDAAIIFAPVGELVPAALRAVRKGGSVVCGGIHMSDIPSFPYRDLWGERVLRSVANLTRRDGYEFLERAAVRPPQISITTYPLAEVNRALDDLRHGRFQGSGVVAVDSDLLDRPSG